MNSFNIYMRSFTQAEKARSFLAGNGIRSIVERGYAGAGRGCGFSLRVFEGKADRNEVCRLLARININCDIS